ncbi:hypothetical protein A2960_04815 [Candidatus Gottesmanbacteria bacterium RIFCSPLOWO2_01_FULL_39_12b]|uniref:DUF1003 domain-containing protein n=1 Tax=Candidatus Gottesmanbacteria bacterium RIFCSPLOWO2_01_FULL_39_12b TaxID=1798388 RepID=A0A1F6ANK0_9BACT|nr:MAG: hypothetical protein A2960_04815 [Candidatus Gottesmanbacteria bacterium RIFCSPLOWO2_01_FULL_39_12b]
MEKFNQSESNQPSTFHNSRRIIRSLKARADAKRTLSEKIADWMTRTFGSIPFLIVNILWFSLWILVNTNVIGVIVPFDPFPFGLLTMIVSLEAIILAIFVLISQNRASQIDDLREEIDLQVDVITEQELTKVMEMLSVLMEKNGIDVSKDQILGEMLRPTSISKIEKALEKQVSDRY